MPPALLPRALFFYGIAILFAGLSALKSATALVSKKPYVFSFWDGGMLRKGRTLSQGATVLKLLSSLAVIVICLGALLGLIPIREATWFIFGAVAVMIVSSFGGMAKATEPKREP